MHFKRKLSYPLFSILHDILEIYVFKMYADNDLPQTLTKNLKL